jgi:uncharacterized protein YjbI with pentapeptide repeats
VGGDRPLGQLGHPHQAQLTVAAPEPPDLPDGEPVDSPGSLGVLEGARLHDAVLAGERFGALELVDVEARGCDIANVRARGALVRRVAFERCRFTGALITEARVEDVVFADCRIDLASFGRTAMQRVLFERCVLTGADLIDAELASVCFRDCDLTDADLSGSRWKDCELRGCRIAALRGVECLRGVRMPIDDVVASAAVFAAHLGIRVVEDEEIERAPRSRGS